jgi:hypothetical protein
MRQKDLYKQISVRAMPPGLLSWIPMNDQEERAYARDMLAFTSAQIHLQKHLATAPRFIDEQSGWKKQPLEKRGLSLQFLEDFLDVFCIPESMIFLAVMWMAQTLTSGTGFSFAELMGSKTDKNGVPYLGTVNCFVSHAMSHSSSLDFQALRAYAARHSSSPTLYFFIDVFAINQNNVGGEGELEALETVIREAHLTVLICDLWHKPSVLRRIWCLFEIEKTITHGGELELCFR